ncbi:MAG: excinuclease ABC subunit UvrA [Crocinitomicaceae bacterium]|nr:excinuclease ABC subunit UvrA [Crocinitomicaceae bacterium]
MAKQSFIEIKGARVNNLKNLSVKIPHGKFTVITGLSGSGKSSLAFDTLYAEGQRRYIESLSSYARQFLGKLDKPETDYIKGISPAIAIEQKVISNNPRSTVGTTTEIYDYLKLLFARIGKTYSPISGKEVKRHTVTDVINFITTLPDNERILILAPVPAFNNYGISETLKILTQQGYSRLFIDSTITEIGAVPDTSINVDTTKLVIDRATADTSSEELLGRIEDSVHLAFTEGNGECSIYTMSDQEEHRFSTRFELDGIEFQLPTDHLFAFNNPIGACKSCEGYGMIIGIDEELVLPNKNLSVFEGAIVPWKGEMMKEYLQELIVSASKFDFPIHRPIKDLTPQQYELLWKGNRYFTGLNEFFKFLESQTYKIHYRVMLSRFRGKTTCPECRGTRLRSDANNVKINGKSITDIVLTPIHQLVPFFKELQLEAYDKQVSKRILPEIVHRLEFLCNVGLGYLTLNRQSNSLSGGESQRINLATSLGSSLVGSMYILDEPSIGLHPRDTEKLINVLNGLRDLGNTVIVVEHEEDIMRAADELLDIGPMAGIYGGEVVFQGDFKQLIKAKNSITADYLTGKRKIPIPEKRRKQINHLHFSGVRKHNLKDVSVKIPLTNFVCITGVSGSGKSTLIKDIVYPAVRNKLGEIALATKSFEVEGDWKQIGAVELVDQNPIGKSSRSNPVTYVKAFDDIRELFAKQQLAKLRSYKPGFFSFNVDGGRCEMCEGEGSITVGMQFMADIHLTCETCHGTRYKAETLEVEYRGVNISQLLNMDIENALTFFKESNDLLEKKIVEKLQPLVDVGLGYLKMGQSSSTLSGGEAQRIKLASFLSKGSKATPTLFIFDEPTTGLHFHDIEKLIIALNRLIDVGHSVIVIEHNKEVIKCADWVIDLGPEGGELGGNIVFSGTPEDLIHYKESYTGMFLKEVLERKG